MRTALVLLTIGLSLPWAEAAGPPPVSEHPEVKAALAVLDAWVAARVADREQPGLSIGVVYDQNLIWSKGYGFADIASKQPATPATLYRIASISKLFTSSSILQLRDAGKLQLDDPVAKHLSWFQIRNTLPDSPPISIRHLLTHTSGLPREALGVNWSDLTFPDRETMMRRLGDQETVFPPETQWKYSNLALSLAGEIVARVSGKPWSQYVEDQILKPLGMRSTVTLPQSGMAGLSTGYSRRVPGISRTPRPFVDIAAERPAGNLASNVEDIAKFVALQMRDGAAGGAQILKGSTLREMHRIQWLRPDWSGGWGLGFSVRRVGEQVRVGHGGSLPGQRTQIEIAPADKIGIIVFTNADDGDPISYVNQAFDLLTPAIKRAATPAKVSQSADPSWERYTGTYTFQNSDVKVMILDGELTLVEPESESPWASRLVLVPVSPGTFRMTAKGFSYGAIGELLSFETDSSGKVTRMKTAGSYWFRK